MAQSFYGKKNSPRATAAATVAFSCFGGVQIGLGFHELLSARQEYHWIGTFLLGIAFVCYGAYWAILLIRSSKPVNASPD